jgi:hypothetical protein
VFASVDKLADGSRDAQYVVDCVTLQAVHLAVKMRKPLLVEGPPACGKTELATQLRLRRVGSWRACNAMKGSRKRRLLASLTRPCRNLYQFFQDRERVPKIQGLLNECMTFLDDELSVITGPYEDLLSLDEAVEQELILFVTLNVNKNTEPVRALGKMLLQNLQLSMQGLPQLMHVGRGFKEDVASAPNTIMTLRTRDEETARYFLRASAEHRVTRRSLSMERWKFFGYERYEETRRAVDIQATETPLA